MDRLDNTIRPYAWGSTTAIAALLGTEPTGEPQAEMWMGAHPGAPSRTGRGTLVEVIDADPQGELGAAAVAKFGPRLPFLLKILAAGAPSPSRCTPTSPRRRRVTRTRRPAGSRWTPGTATTRTPTTSPN